MIVCIGDSITYGQLLPPGAKPWPSLIGAVGRGMPGDTTRLGLERFPKDVQEPLPDIVVIQFGHNDANRWQTDRGVPRVSLPAFIANIEEMVARAEMFGIEPVICTLTRSWKNDQHAQDCRLYDRALRDVAIRLGYRLADVTGAIWRDLTIDGLHLTEEGHRAYADAVRASLP